MYNSVVYFIYHFTNGDASVLLIFTRRLIYLFTYFGHIVYIPLHNTECEHFWTSLHVREFVFLANYSPNLFSCRKWIPFAYISGSLHVWL